MHNSGSSSSSSLKEHKDTIIKKVNAPYMENFCARYEYYTLNIMDSRAITRVGPKHQWVCIDKIHRATGS